MPETTGITYNEIIMDQVGSHNIQHEELTTNTDGMQYQDDIPFEEEDYSWLNDFTAETMDITDLFCTQNNNL